MISEASKRTTRFITIESNRPTTSAVNRTVLPSCPPCLYIRSCRPSYSVPSRPTVGATVALLDECIVYRSAQLRCSIIILLYHTSYYTNITANRHAEAHTTTTTITTTVPCRGNSHRLTHPAAGIFRLLRPPRRSLGHAQSANH